MCKQDNIQKNKMLKDFDDLIFETRSQLDYQRYLTPVNFASENQTFFDCYSRGEEYNPQYKYVAFEGASGKEDALAAFTKALNEDSDGVCYILCQAAKSLMKEMLLYRSIGNDAQFSELCESIYGTPNHRLIDQAYRGMCDNQLEKEFDEFYTSEHLCEIFKQRLQRYGFDWKITISPHMASRVSVEPEQKKVYIKQGSRFSSTEIRRLQVHEIDTHILRCENGLKRGYKIFSSGTHGSLIHEEGLALYNEWKNGVQDSTVSRLYAARFIACCNIGMSFYKLFDLLVKNGCDQEQTMYVVSRIKRGLSDTSKPGGFIKDYVYFQGFCEIKDFVENNKDKYSYLYYGSISLDDINKLEKEIITEIGSNRIIFPLPI